VLKQTLAQLQEFRSYYAFGDVDVDRYLFGTDKYRQVMLSARELDITLLKSPTWVTQHLKYTHGYGVVGAWPDRATAQGRPELFLRDIPPVPVDQTTLNVKRPEIYYGEQPDNYVVAGSTERELDYPSGDTQHLHQLQGHGRHSRLKPAAPHRLRAQVPGPPAAVHRLTQEDQPPDVPPQYHGPRARAGAVPENRF